MKVILIIVNLFVPGVGTIFMGKILQGIIQLAMTIVAWALWWSILFSILGFIIGGVAWIWALVVGINWAQPKKSIPPSSGIGR